MASDTVSHNAAHAALGIVCESETANARKLAAELARGLSSRLVTYAERLEGNKVVFGTLEGDMLRLIKLIGALEVLDSL